MAPTHPEIRWAQRSSEHNAEKNIVFFTVQIPDLDPSYDLKVEEQSVTFSGKSKTSDQLYEFKLDLFGSVEPEEGKKVQVLGKGLQLTLRKKELNEEYWPRLTKDKKVQFIKTDFDKWRDQDEQDAAEGALGGDDEDPMAGMDMSSMMSQMGGGGGMPGMPGMGGMGGFGGGGDTPDMSALMSQLGSMGGAGAGAGEGADPDDSDDDDMPALEEPSADKGKGKAVDA